MDWRDPWITLDRGLKAWDSGRTGDCCYNTRTALIDVWLKVCNNLGENIEIPSGKTPDIKILRNALEKHGFKKDIISFLGTVWSLASDRTHIEREEGKNPPETETYLILQLTVSSIEYLLKELLRRK